jgi:hypothetical protein
MSMSFTGMLLAHSEMCRAVREALRNSNDLLRDAGVRLSEWPIERPGCLYALSVTIDDRETGQELGECRFTLDWRGFTYFDADDAPLKPCAAETEACELAVLDFVQRRLADIAQPRTRTAQAA